jgi:hypothetical protein
MDFGALPRILARSASQMTVLIFRSTCTFWPSGAAQESNLPTVGLPRPAGLKFGHIRPWESDSAW